MPGEPTPPDRTEGGEAIVQAILEALPDPTLATAGRLTSADLAPATHFHAGGIRATAELADHLTLEARHRVLDAGCGVGGPAWYLAERFGCQVEGLDLSEAYVHAAGRLNALVSLEDRVRFQVGDAQALPFPDEAFDGVVAQHVTMNLPHRPRFLAEARRVLKPGGFLALAEHGLGPAGEPRYPTPWSDDGSGSFLLPPEASLSLLKEAGFVDLHVADVRAGYLAAYEHALELADEDGLPPLSPRILLGAGAGEKLRNAYRNIVEERTEPLQVVARRG